MKQTVEKLAQDAGVEVDDALLILWDAGIETVEQPTDVVPKRVVSRAKRAFGMASRRKLASIDYWYRIFGLDKTTFENLLKELEIDVAAKNKRLSKKMISRLRSEARNRGRESVSEDPKGKQKSEKLARVKLSDQPLIWQDIGYRPEQIRSIKVDEICAIHEALVKDFEKANDPIDPPGLRSQHLLASALSRQTTSIDGIKKYPTVEMAGSALLHSLVHNHPFHNGNKRTGLVALIVFLDENGFKLTCDEDELFRFVLQVAKHGLLPNNQISDRDDREVMEISEWIQRNSRRIEQGNRPIQWRKLKRILANYGCEITFATVGNRINLTRTAYNTGFFGRQKKINLRTQVAYTDDGRDADRSVVAKIRQDLQLDDMHGIDSRDFYEERSSDSLIAEDFILKYRKTLRQLSKL